MESDTTTRTYAQRVTTVVKDRRALNALMPISKLNDDILTSIFMLNAHLDFIHVHIPSTTTRYTSQVIHRWRNLLLNYPLVWAASLDFGDTRAWLQIVFMRTGNAPLTIILPSVSRCMVNLAEKTGKPLSHLTIPELQHSYGHSPVKDDTLYFALSLLPRCKKINIKVDTLFQSKYISHKLPTLPAPRLRELSLDMDEYHKVCILEDDDIPADRRFSPPNLKRLDLRGCGTNFMSPLYEKLTVLYATNLPAGKGMTAQSWLTLLRGLPQLEYLKLCCCFVEHNALLDDASPENSTNSTDPVSLPCLRWFELTGDCWSCHNVYSAISVPTSCSLYITYESLNNFVHPVSTIMTALGKKVHSHFPDIKVLSVNMVGAENFTASNHNYVGHGDKILYISFSKTIFDIARVLPQLVDLLRFISCDVQELYVSWWTLQEIYPLQLWNIFEPFEQVNVLRVRSRQVLPILAGMHRVESLPSRDHVVIPRLSKLLLSGIEFVSDAYVYALVSFLQTRSNIEAPIKSILLRRCSGPLMETVVTQVRTMGIELDVDEEPDDPNFRVGPLITPE